MRSVLTSSEAAWLLRVDPRNLPRVARAHGVEPLPRVRIGRSWVTRWAVEDIARLAPGPGHEL
jgi:hypothetical protein